MKEPVSLISLEIVCVILKPSKYIFAKQVILTQTISIITSTAVTKENIITISQQFIESDN